MIIINNSADYSDLGIGKAPIVSEETKALLAGFPSVTNDEMLAFQDFMYDIGGTDGVIWDALDRIYFPIFAHGVLKDAFFELKSGNVVYPKASITDDTVANTWELTTKGVKILSTQERLDGAFTNVQRRDDNIMLFILSEPHSVGGRYAFNFGEVGTSSTGTIMKVQGNGNLFQIPNSLGKDIIALFNVNDTTGYSFGSVDTFLEKTNTSYSPALETKPVLIGCSQTQSQKWPVGIKAYGFGDGLSVENARILGDAIIAFNNAMAELS